MRSSISLHILLRHLSDHRELLWSHIPDIASMTAHPCTTAGLFYECEFKPEDANILESLTCSLINIRVFFICLVLARVNESGDVLTYVQLREAELLGVLDFIDNAEVCVETFDDVALRSANLIFVVRVSANTLAIDGQVGLDSKFLTEALRNRVANAKERFVVHFNVLLNKVGIVRGCIFDVIVLSQRFFIDHNLSV